jgi:secreted trypsin-like serine protease
MKILEIIFFLPFASAIVVDIEQTIAGGVIATPHQFPFAVAITSRNINFSPRLCGGSIISRQSILTAAFCIYNQIDITVILGSHDIENENEPFQVRFTIPQQDVRTHPAFVSGQTTNDIAILRLPGPIGFFNHAINLVNLPADPQENFLNVVAITMGFGSECWQANCFPINILKVIGVNTRPSSECNAQSTQMCATNQSGGPCGSDEGGPLVVSENGTFVQIGIIRMQGNRCQGAATYMRITNFLPWIRQNL